MTPTQFDRAEIQRLLRLLDARLRRRGVGASVYVVGGAAIAVTWWGVGARPHKW